MMSRTSLVFLLAIGTFGAGCGFSDSAAPTGTYAVAEGSGHPTVPTATSSDAPPNTQPLTIPLVAPADALEQVEVPDGFRASLFAAEPDVQQPIAMAQDPRGRLWIAECYTYGENGKFDPDLRDRIVILEDSNGDGQSDQRTVFWDKARNLTSVEIGFGGVWALCMPHLLFIPDADGDDRPDGEPIVVLDGWEPAGHTLVNGLRWGPDGWLYGRHGIQGTSFVGRPGDPAEQRTALNCGIWRYHPIRKSFEVVCHGTTNPWGMDWNDHGQLFFINTVIGHLWHVLPNAYYRRMYGEHLRPDLYELIDQTADHVHWDEGQEEWTAQRKGVSAGTDRAGGGHAHTGLMFYLGTNWPDRYRDQLFTINLHGRRLNQDSVERGGATYVGRHRPDLVKWGDPWFRGIDLAYGHDGGVYVLDWSDIGECHEADGLHRTSGRIYKITWQGETDRTRQDVVPVMDLAKLSNDQLAALQLDHNEWIVRQARHQLYQRHVKGDDMTTARQSLVKVLDASRPSPSRLRALWALHVTGEVGEDRLLKLLGDQDEHLRVWALQLLADRGTVTDRARAAMLELARQEPSGLVRAYLASILRLLPAPARFELAGTLVAHPEFADDRVLPLMVWYGVEPMVRDESELALALIRESRMPQVTEHVSRRLTSAIDQQPASVAGLLEILRATSPSGQRTAILAGMAAALRGWDHAPAPAGWDEFARRELRTADAQTASYFRELSIVFAQGIESAEVLAFVADQDQATESRRQAMRSLAAADVAGLSDVLVGLLDDREVVEEAVRTLATIDLGKYASLLLERYAELDGSGKDAAVEVLATRPDTAALLLDAVERRVVPRTEIDVFLLRQMQMLGDPSIAARVAAVWPEQKLIEEDKVAKAHRYREMLSDHSMSSADLQRGRELYRRTCGQCHKLFGEGESIGPELTGAQRHNLAYWLENILDPSAVIPDQYRMSLVELTDGRLLSGLIGEQSERTLVLQTPSERLVLQRREIAAIEPSALSLMPDGQLDTMSESEVRDLVAYLMSDGP